MIMRHFPVLAFVFVLVMCGCASIRNSDDVSICEVHRIKMEYKRVPVRYGLVSYPPGYINAKPACFPHGWEYVNGGCVIQDLKETKIPVCPDCKKAEQACARMWHDAFNEGKHREERQR